MKEEDEDDIGLIEAHVFMKEPQEKIDATKLSLQQRLEPKIRDDKIRK